jgi:hypothetical protein
MRIKNILKLSTGALLAITLGFTTSQANSLNAIALVVNEEPITVFDIEEKMYITKKKKAAAVSELIDEVLFNQEVEKQNVTADVLDINEHLERIAQSNGMDLYTFKSIIKQKYKDYSIFEEQTKQQVLKQKLAAKLVRGNLKIATDADLRIYYNNNKKIFTTATTIEATQFASKDKRALTNALNNPMSINESVTKTPVTLEQSQLNPQLRFLLNDTQINQFTPIFTASNQYVSLLVAKKEGVSVLNFEDVKERIFNVVMRDREQNFLKEYFEKLKLTADIKIVR